MISGAQSNVIMLSTRSTQCGTFIITNRPEACIGLANARIDCSRYVNLARMEKGDYGVVGAA